MSNLLVPFFVSIIAGLWLALFSFDLSRAPKTRRISILVLAIFAALVSIAVLNFSHKRFHSAPYVFALVEEEKHDKLVLRVVVEEYGGITKGKRFTAHMTAPKKIPDAENKLRPVQAIRRLEFKRPSASNDMDIWAIDWIGDSTAIPTVRQFLKGTFEFDPSDGVHFERGIVVTIQAPVSLNDILACNDSLYLLGYDGTVYTTPCPPKPPADTTTVVEIKPAFSLHELYEPTVDDPRGWQSLSLVNGSNDDAIATNGLRPCSVALSLSRVRLGEPPREVALTFDSEALWPEDKQPWNEEEGIGVDAGRRIATFYSGAGPGTVGETSLGSTSYPEGVIYLDSIKKLIVSDRNGSLRYMTFLQKDQSLKRRFSGSYEKLRGEVRHGQGLGAGDDGIWFAAEDHFRFVANDAFAWWFTPLDWLSRSYRYIIGVVVGVILALGGYRHRENA